MADSTKPDSRVSHTGRLISEARDILAYGGLDGVVQRSLFDNDGRMFPHYAMAAEGCRLTDSLGRTYVDWVNGWGPTLLGYREPRVETAIKEQLAAGPTLSLMHPVELDVAKLVCDMIPSAEMVAFGKNGSDSVTAALRIARAHTGRELVLQYGFHGFHDWYTCLHEGVQGITPVLKEYVRSFDYNDLDSLEHLLNQHASQVAAIIMEPVNMYMPRSGYLEAVRELATHHGCLLVFDEMVTAFRLSNGGAQELFGVEPDLTCIGKSLGNGMPLSAIVGQRRFMKHLPSCGFGMTFRGETLSLAAAKACLSIIRDEPVCEHISRAGQQLRAGFSSLCDELQIDCELSGPNGRMTFVFHDQGSHSWQSLRDTFLKECMHQGILTNGNILPGYAHDQDAIASTLEGMKIALKRLRSLLDEPTDTPARIINPNNVQGYLERLDVSDHVVNVEGWLLFDHGAPTSVEFRLTANADGMAACATDRPDLESAFPEHPNAAQAGFRGQIPLDAFAQDQHCEFMIVAHGPDSQMHYCLVHATLPTANTGPWPLDSGVVHLD